MQGAMFILAEINNYLIIPILLAYAGYVCVKEKKGARADGAYSGATAGAVAGLVLAVSYMVLFPLVAKDLAVQAPALTLLFGFAAAICQLASLAMMVVGGAIFGMVGAWIADRK